jgi:hypothetical protein
LKILSNALTSKSFATFIDLLWNVSKLIAQRKSTIEMSRFNIGERVNFNGPDGREHSGHIFRLNKKTVSIKTIEGEQWNVTPGLLKEPWH